jgi:peptide chain release factor 1
VFDKLSAVEAQYEKLMAEMADPAVQGDTAKFRAHSKTLSDIQPLVERFGEYKKVIADLTATEEMLKDPDMRELAQAELPSLEGRRDQLLADLRLLLVPKDPNDAKNVVLEIRAGAGGDEAALFAADLFRMYSRYAERQGWRVEVLNLSDSGTGGVKEVTAIIEGRGVYSRLKYESGVHRVQRVPATEASGRIHTSTATVAVLPEAEEVDIHIDAKDLRIDTFCSSGPGGQSVNTTYSAVRITHIPTGIVVQCQNERSQLQNRNGAMKILKARLFEVEQQKKEAEFNAIVGEKKDIAWGSQIRSYVFQPYQMVKDHRTGYEVGNVSSVMDGDIDGFIQAYLKWKMTGGKAAMAALSKDDDI